MRMNQYYQKIRKIVLSAGAEEEEYQSVMPEILQSNRSIVLTFSHLVIPILMCLFVVSFVVKDLAPNRILYGGFLFPLLLSAWLAWKGAERTAWIYTAMYLFMCTMLGLGMVMGTVMGRHEITAVFIAILLITPQLFDDRPWHFYLLILFFVILFIYMAIRFKDPETWASDITNVVVFAILSVFVCTYIIKIRVHRFILNQKVMNLAEFDQLTRLKNRNCYERKVHDLNSKGDRQVFCVFIDVNGLHELNNTKGHEAGDRMLQYIAASTKNVFAGKSVYRIGGDEFVVLGNEMEEAEIQRRTQLLKEQVQKENYNIAVGFEYCRDNDRSVTDTIRLAEQRMYKDKAAFYSSGAHDRRNRRS